METLHLSEQNVSIADPKYTDKWDFANAGARAAALLGSAGYSGLAQLQFLRGRRGPALIAAAALITTVAGVGLQVHRFVTQEVPMPFVRPLVKMAATAGSTGSKE